MSIITNYHYNYGKLDKDERDYVHSISVSLDEAMNWIKDMIQCYYQENVSNFDMGKILSMSFQRVDTGDLYNVTGIHSFLEIVKNEYKGDKELPNMRDYKYSTLIKMKNEYKKNK